MCPLKFCSEKNNKRKSFSAMISNSLAKRQTRHNNWIFTRRLVWIYVSKSIRIVIYLFTIHRSHFSTPFVDGKSNKFFILRSLFSLHFKLNICSFPLTVDTQCLNAKMCLFNSNQDFTSCIFRAALVVCACVCACVESTMFIALYISLVLFIKHIEEWTWECVRTWTGFRDTNM